MLLGSGNSNTITCNKCGSTEVKKIISAPSIVFKGTGFYETDYKKKPAEKCETENKINDT